LLVTALDEDGAAAIQGLLQGDRIVRVNKSPATLAAFDAMTKAIAIATPVRFVVARGGATQVLRITTGIAAP
jgi:S1-C subfamily serine protease